MLETLSQIKMYIEDIENTYGAGINNMYGKDLYENLCKIINDLSTGGWYYSEYQGKVWIPSFKELTKEGE